MTPHPALTPLLLIAALAGFVLGLMVMALRQQLQHQPGDAQKKTGNPLPFDANEAQRYVEKLGQPRLVIATGTNENDPVVVLYRGRDTFPATPIPYQVK